MQRPAADDVCMSERSVPGGTGDHLSKGEIRKDAVQDVVSATATTVGEVGTILTGAVRDLADAVGGFATELFAIRDSARRAAQDHPEDPAAG